MNTRFTIEEENIVAIYAEELPISGTAPLFFFCPCVDN